jgi:hypothetical protein
MVVSQDQAAPQSLKEALPIGIEFGKPAIIAGAPSPGKRGLSGVGRAV